MDALTAAADAIKPLNEVKKGSKSKQKHAGQKPNAKRPDATLHSVTPRADLPRSMRPAATESKTRGPYAHIRDKKLKAKLHSQVAQASQAKALRQDATTWLAGEPGGKMEVETELERIWRTTQDDIAQAAGSDSVTGRREWKWDLGPYRVRYSRNGRFLQDHTLYAVAQKKYAYIYDQNGVELHRLKSIVEPTRLEFLPYHWLLASIGNAGYLKYLDTSTGTMIAEQRTKLGACNAMTQNIHNAVIYLGHQNGTVALHTPSTPTPLVRLQAHLGPITSLSVDPSSGGRYLATAGQDSRVKIWDCRNWKGRGWLGVIAGGSINVYAPPAVYTPAPRPNSTIPPSLYLTHPIPHRPLVSMRFCPFEDTIAIGHAHGVSSIIVPGSGEANIDSFEDGVFENKRARQERELQPDMITLDPEFIGQLAEPGHIPFTTPELPFRQKPRLDRLRELGKADESPASDGEEVDDINADGGDEKSGPIQKEKMKMRGKGKSLKRYLRKKRKNVIDPSTVAIREKIAKVQATRKAEARQKAGLSEKEPQVQVYERAYTTHIADIEEVSQVLFQSSAIVFGTEENPSYETITGPHVLSHVFNVPNHMPSALQSKHKRAQVIWKLVFKVYRKSGTFKQYVVASGEPNVLLDILYRHKIDTSGNNTESNEGHSFEFDVIIPGTFMSVTHRIQLTMAWKGRFLDKVISHPIAIAALSHSERQRAIEEVAQIEMAPSIAPPFRNDDVPPPSYVSTQHLLNESSATLMPQCMDDELSSISYRSNIDTPSTGSIVHGATA
ncbi:unnamed protein product [Rhizoctonia solani]|uniref:BING4 C-terminal domain-containing protein n=1 Tax=Rhizoctonia solani TaxID=456999 RepID=A0A8H3DSK0_9AGAM|nr:unnamed protein product [Rhizoctonia solani]